MELLLDWYSSIVKSLRIHTNFFFSKSAKGYDDEAITSDIDEAHTSIVVVHQHKVFAVVMSLISEVWKLSQAYHLQICQVKQLCSYMNISTSHF